MRAGAAARPASCFVCSTTQRVGLLLRWAPVQAGIGETDTSQAVVAFSFIAQKADGGFSGSGLLAGCAPTGCGHPVPRCRVPHWAWLQAAPGASLGRAGGGHPSPQQPLLTAGPASGHGCTRCELCMSSEAASVLLKSWFCPGSCRRPCFVLSFAAARKEGGWLPTVVSLCHKCQTCLLIIKANAEQL